MLQIGIKSKVSSADISVADAAQSVLFHLKHYINNIIYAKKFTLGQNHLVNLKINIIIIRCFNFCFII